MKKNILETTLVATFALLAGYNVYNSQKAEGMSELALLMWKHWLMTMKLRIIMDFPFMISQWL